MDTPSADLIEKHRDYMKAGGLAYRTRTAACDLLYRVDAGLPRGIAETNRDEIASWLAGPDDPDDAWSAQTKAIYLEHLRRFYRWATDSDDPRLDFDPSARLRRPRIHPAIPDPATDDEVRAAVTLATAPFRLHCILAAYAGLRPVEIAALRREDVGPEMLRVRRGKGAKPAVIPTEPPVWRAIADLEPGPVTRRMDGLPADAHWVSIATATHLHRRLKLARSLRNLRHWHGTMLRATYDLRLVQERLRHASVRSTQGYTAVSGGEMLRSVGTLPDFTREY